MDYVHSLRRFLCRLAIHSGTLLHVRYVRHGHAWPAIWDAQRCVYHHCLVMPYVGGESRRKGSPRAIPRIHLNHHNPSGHAPADQLERRARAAWPGRVATVYGAKLELTATIEELPLLGAWVVAWAAAKVAKDAGRVVELPQPPVALENPPPPEELLAFDYLWTQAAADEYSAFRDPRAQREAALLRNRKECQTRGVSLPSSGSMICPEGTARPARTSNHPRQRSSRARARWDRSHERGCRGHRDPNQQPATWPPGWHTGALTVALGTLATSPAEARQARTWATWRGSDCSSQR